MLWDSLISMRKIEKYSDCSTFEIGDSLKLEKKSLVIAVKQRIITIVSGIIYKIEKKS